MLLLRDGRLLISETGEQGIWLLWSPDAYGSYENGTCTRAADMPQGYGPRAFASAVLPDGRVYVCGGEYNLGKSEWTNLCSIYTPDAGKGSWQMIGHPDGWHSIGDAPATVLPNGKVLQLNCCSNQAAILDLDTLTWTATGSTSIPHNHETLTVLMQTPGAGKVELTDTDINFNCGLSDRSSEIYDVETGQWSCGPQLPAKMWGPPDNEAGPAVMLPNGNIFQTPGLAEPVTAVMDSSATQWTAAVSTGGWMQDDSASALLPDGTVLGLWRTADKSDCAFMVYDPVVNTLSPTVNACIIGYEASSRLTVIPTGQVAYTYGPHYIWFYNSGTSALQAAAPQILAFSSLVVYPGRTYNLYGKQLNGLSQASMKDDDAQQATNYPLVRVISADGKVRYLFTHGDSYSGITPGVISYTKVDFPSDLALGKYMMQVVTNGIASNSLSITVGALHP